MEKYLKLVELYKNDKKEIKKNYIIFLISYTIIMFGFFCVSHLIKAYIIEKIVLIILCMGLFFSFSNIGQDFIFKIIKKMNKKIKTEEILGIFKYDDYRVLSQWKVYTKMINNTTCVTLSEGYTPNKETYMLKLGYGFDVEISEKLYNHLKIANEQDAYLILNENEFQNILKTKYCNDCVTI